MMTQIKIKDAAGLPFKDVLYSSGAGRILILLGNSSFCCLGAGVDGGGYSDVEWDAEPNLLEFYPPEQIIKAGICSEEELEQLRIESRRAWEARQEEQDRRVYERLKQKFEGS